MDATQILGQCGAIAAAWDSLNHVGSELQNLDHRDVDLEEIYHEVGEAMAKLGRIQAMLERQLGKRVRQEHIIREFQQNENT